MVHQIGRNSGSLLMTNKRIFLYNKDDQKKKKKRGT